MKKSLASDNCSGVHPKILEYIVEINNGHCPAYGEDSYTSQAVEEVKNYFGDVKAYFVYNGTGANVLALDAMKGKASSVICADTAHIFSDETGAPSKITGMQLFPVQNINGKLDLEAVKKYVSYRNSFHKPNPSIISISQTTETGTVYSLEEIKEIGKFAKENGMLFHMDGARISNAAVSLGCSFKEMTSDLGVDVLCLGGTKNGLMMGEVIVFFNEELAENFLKLRKQDLQLNSKMRFLSAQFIPYLRNNIWYESAKNANDMAKYLSEELKKNGIVIVNKVEANTIFAILPKQIIKPLQEFCHFHVWDEDKNEVRFVTSFDIEKNDIDLFISKLKSLTEGI